MAENTSSLLSLLPNHSFVMAKRVAQDPSATTQTPHTFLQFQGSPHPQLLFVGEGILLGGSGELLSRMIAPMNPPPNAVTLANISDLSSIDPSHALIEEILPLQPRIMVLLGERVASRLLGAGRTLNEFRGHLHSDFGIKSLVTYSPQDLLQNAGLKKAAWEDLKRVMTELGWKIT